MPELNKAPAAPKQQAKEPKKTERNIPIDYPAFSGDLENLASAAYDKRVYLPLLETVLLEFGVGRRKMFRSTEVNKFRDVMKETARKKANADIDELTKNSNQQESVLLKFHKSSLAKKDAYKESKLAVKSVMESEAKKIISLVADEIPTTMDIAKHAIPKVDLGQPREKVLKKFAEAADKEAKLEEKEVRVEAVAKAKDLVATFNRAEEADTTKDRLAAQQGTAHGDLLVSVKNSADKQGMNSFSKFATIKEDNITSAFAKVATAVKKIVPNVGDQASAEFELNIPIGLGVIIVIKIGANCEHDNDDVEVTDPQGNPLNRTRKQEYFKVGAEVNVGAGGKISAKFVKAAIKGTIGMFLEATGKRAEDALSLLSYGLYRVLYNKAPDVASSLWGEGGKTGFSSFQEAEMWAAMIEKNMLNDEHSNVMIGLQASVSGEVETQKAFQEKKNYGFETEGEFKFQKYYEYSRDILKNAKIDSASQFEDKLKQIKELQGIHSGGAGAALNFNTVLNEKKAKFKNNIHHKTKAGISASADFKFGEKAGFGCGIEGALIFDHNNDDPAKLHERKLSLEKIEFAVNASFPESVEKLDSFNQALPKITDFASSVIGSTLNKSKNDKNNGTMIGRETGLLAVNSALHGYINTLKVEDTPFENSWGSSLNAIFAFEIDCTGGGDHSITLEFRRTQTHEIDLEIANFSVEKSKRIHKIKIL